MVIVFIFARLVTVFNFWNMLLKVLQHRVYLTGVTGAGEVAEARLVRDGPGLLGSSVRARGAASVAAKVTKGHNALTFDAPSPPPPIPYTGFTGSGAIRT